MVRRCVCFGKSFLELKKLARKHDVHTIEELQKFVTFGKNCQRCHPYVKKMLETGETTFEVIESKTDANASE